MTYPRAQRAKNFKYVRYTGGDFSYVGTSTTWTQFNSSIADITIAAQAGDILVAFINGHTNTLSQAQFLDVATMVGGSPVNYFATAGSSTGWGLWWNGSQNPAFINAGPYPYLTVAGDISNYTVTCRLMARSAGTNAIKANVNEPLTFMVCNWGPQDNT